MNKSLSRTRSSRNSTASRIPIEPTNAWGAIDDERRRLMTAEAVLHCVVVAMDEDDASVHNADYQILVELARDLIKHVIDQLDSVRLKPMLAKTRADGGHNVKEETTVYVH